MRSCREHGSVKIFTNLYWPIGRTDAEAEAPILWPPNAKIQPIGKNPDAGKDWGQKGKEVTEDEMVRWHNWLDGHEFEQTPGDGEGQGRLACCSPWGHKGLTQLSSWTTTLAHLIPYVVSPFLLGKNLIRVIEGKLIQKYSILKLVKNLNVIAI